MGKLDIHEWIKRCNELQAENEKLRACVELFSQYDSCGEYGFSEATKTLEKLKQMRGSDE